MQKLLILTESYPNKESVDMAYVHTRSLYYKKMGIDVQVLCFKSNEDYLIDEIQVWTERGFDTKGGGLEQFDLLVSHAPNLKNHLRFLCANRKIVKNVIFVIHGHEVLKKVEYYPLPYPKLQNKNYQVGKLINQVYDYTKLGILSFLFRHYFNSKVHLVFVSNWMLENFCRNLHLPVADVKPVSSVIHNSIHEVFEVSRYNPNGEKMADFISIRPFDSPKYCVDVITEIARRNPGYQFHLYGKGSYFSAYDKPANLTVINKFFSQRDLPNILNKYRAALMPTRLDSQGVMMCEMASFGIPLVTSDIPICHEMLDGFSNVSFINNESPTFDISKFMGGLDFSKQQLSTKFHLSNTIEREVSLFKQLIERRIHPLRKVLHVNDIASVGSTLCLQQNKVGTTAELVDMPKPLAEHSLLIKSFGFFKRWKFAKNVRAKIRREGFNILHVHYVSAGLFFFFQKTSFVIQAHGSDIRVSRFNYLRRFVNYLIMRRADKIIYSTPDLKSYTEKFSDKSEFLPNPIDTDMFAPSSIVPTKDLLLFSSISDIKGAEVAIPALRILKTKYPELKISVFGYGDMVDDFDLEGFEVLPKVARSELPALISNYKLILGQFKVGAIGMSDLEAMSCQKIVATYFIYDEVYVEKIPILNTNRVDRLVEFVEQYVIQGTPRESLEKTSRDWVVKYHSKAQVTEKLSQLYDNIKND